MKKCKINENQNYVMLIVTDNGVNIVKAVKI